jgi:DNA-directed RNA polymerase specialized sigma24 family protein
MVQSHGDSRGFESFFETSRDDIFRSLLVITKDRSLAEDGVAEAFARALERWAEVAGHPVPKAWVARTALNYFRSDRRRSRRLDSDMPEGDSRKGGSGRGTRPYAKVTPWPYVQFPR